MTVEDEIASLFCKIITGSDPVTELAELERFHVIGQCVHPADEIRRQLEEVVAAWSPMDIDAAEPAPRLLPGDIRLSLQDGREGWVEVKAQVGRPDFPFSYIVQADWEQEGTTALAWLLQHDDDFAHGFPAHVAASLASLVPPQGWSFSDLVAADIAGIPSPARMHEAGVHTPADLHEFLHREYFLHLTSEGARFYRLTDLTAIQSYLEGVESQRVVLSGDGQSAKKVRVAWGNTPGHGTTQFTYIIYDRPHEPYFGRHKLHEAGIGTRFVARILTDEA